MTGKGQLQDTVISCKHSQVELLEQKWNRICDVAAGREEEMKEIRLQ